MSSSAQIAAPSREFAIQYRDFMIGRLREEHEITKRVLLNLRDGEWRPDPHSRTAMELAWHIVSSEIWFLDSIATGKFEFSGEPPLPATLNQLREFYDRDFTLKIERLREIPAEKLLTKADFFGMDTALYELLNFTQVHTIHHRGQLATYLRALGGKCPDIYGGSFDEPSQQPAA